MTLTWARSMWSGGPLLFLEYEADAGTLWGAVQNNSVSQSMVVIVSIDPASGIIEALVSVNDAGGGAVAYNSRAKHLYLVSESCAGSEKLVIVDLKAALRAPSCKEWTWNLAAGMLEQAQNISDTLHTQMLVGFGCVHTLHTQMLVGFGCVLIVIAFRVHWVGTGHGLCCIRMRARSCLMDGAARHHTVRPWRLYSRTALRRESWPALGQRATQRQESDDNADQHHDAGRAEWSGGCLHKFQQRQ
jgi:hypothetical protein